MEKRIIFNLKKLCAFLILSLTIMGGFILASCGGKNYTATFKEESYSLSRSQTIDITNDIELENITLQDLTFHSSDESILSVKTSTPLDKESKTQITGEAPGKAVLYIYLRGETLDSINVTVKNKFATPTNIQVSASGLVTWDAVSCVVDGETVSPSGYEVYVAKSANDFKIEQTPTNSYQLDQKGVYVFCVKALGNDFIDDSDDSVEQELYYQALHAVTNFKYTNITDGVGEKGTLSWSAVENADYYRLNIDSMEILTSSTTYALDLSSYTKNQSAVISVTAVQDSGELMDGPTVSLRVVKLGLDNVGISNGSLRWSKNDNAASYIIHYESLTDATIKGNITTTDLSTYLDDLDADAYSISVQAVGKTGGNYGVYYANSPVYAISGNVAKLGSPEFAYEINGNKISVTISTDQSELKNFQVKFVETATRREIVRDVQITGEAVGGKYSTTLEDIELPEVGKYNVIVKALASGMTRYEIDGTSCRGILDSTSTALLQVYKLPSVRTISHTYGENQESIVSFARPAYETNYSKVLDYIVKVNGKNIEIKSKEFKNGSYFLNIGEITSDYDDPTNPLQYLITVETTLNGLSVKEECIGDVASKSLERLSVSVMGLEGNQLTSNYTYSARNASGYKYTTYSTNSIFEGKLNKVAEVEDAYGRMPKPSAGYYILDVVAYSNNPNQYLNGTASDFFYVTTTLATPVLDFGHTENKLEDSSIAIDKDILSGYYVEITAVDEATNYDVYLDEVLCENVTDADADGKIYYYFLQANDFSTDDHTIKVVAKGDDDFLFYTSEKEITVEKLSTPAAGTQSEQTLKFTYSNGNLRFYKNSVASGNELSATEINPTANAGEYEYTFDLSALTNDLTLIVFAVKDAVEGEAYYIQSEQVSFKIHKIATMTDFYFSGENVYFTYNDALASAALTPGTTNANISLLAKVSLIGGSMPELVFEKDIQSITTLVSGKNYTFELMDLVDALVADDATFESLYTQKDSIKLQLVVECSYYEGDTQTYVFSSQNAISRENVEKDFITIEKIARPLAYFSEGDSLIYWADEEGAFDYEIEVDGEVTAQAATYSAANERYEFNLASLISPKTELSFRFRKSADNYLDSNWSNTITMYFMASVPSINVVTNQDGESFARFTYVDANVDQTRIVVNVNGTAEVPVTYDESHTSYQFQLVPTVVNYVVNIVGYHDTDAEQNKTYFVGCASTAFVLEALEPVATASQVAISNSEMTWNPYSLVDTPKYQVILYDGADVAAKITVNNTKLSLANATLLHLSQASYRVEVYAVNRDFSINAGGRGYYGGTVISSGSLVKLDEVTDLALSFEETGTAIDVETSKTLTANWTWEGEHNADSAVKFELYVNTTLYETIDLVGGQTEYQATVDEADISEFENAIKVKVISDRDIVSETTIKDIHRFTSPDIEVSDEKILSIDFDSVRSPAGIVATHFIVRVKVEGTNVAEFKTDAEENNLSSYLDGKSGAITVEVIAKGISNLAVWSKEIEMFEGTLLEAPTIEQTESGVTLSSTDEDVEYYVTIKQGATIIVPETKANGDVFAFAEIIGDGTYTVLAVARKAGNLTSSVASQEITISRLQAVSNIKITRNRFLGANTYSTYYELKWNTVAGSVGYEVTFYTSGGATIYSTTTTETKVTLTDTILFAPGFANLLAGNYIIGVRTLGDIADEKSNALETRSNIVVTKEAENITVTDGGLVSWVGNGNFCLYATDGVETTFWTINETNAVSIGGGKFRYTQRVDKVSGLTSIFITRIGVAAIQQSGTSTMYLDSRTEQASYTKLKPVSAVDLNVNSGLISFTTTETFTSEITFFFEYVNNASETVTYNCVITDVDENVYSLNFAELYDALGIETEGEVTVKVYISQTSSQDPDGKGKLRSEDFTFAFENTIAVESDYYAGRSQDFLHDYLMINAKEGYEVKQIYLKKNGTEYMIITPADKYGYWNVLDNGSENFTDIVDASAVSSKEVYALLVNDYETSANGANFTLSMAYCYTADSVEFGFNGWSEVYSYTKLPTTNDPVGKNGKLIWSISASEFDAKITGYYIDLIDESGASERIYVKASETLEFDASIIPSSFKNYEIKVTTVNADSTFVIGANSMPMRTPTGKFYTQVFKYDALSIATKLNAGVLTVNLERDGSDESYGKLSGEVLTSGTEILEDDMPYGYGLYFEIDTSKGLAAMQTGTGTFTAINYDGNLRYIRTKFITKSGTTYTVNADAKLYANYNIALEDVVANSNAKFASSKSNFLKNLSRTQFTYPFAFTISTLVNGNTLVLTFVNSDTGAKQLVKVAAEEVVKISNDTLKIIRQALEDLKASGAGVTGYTEAQTLVNTFVSDAKVTGTTVDSVTLNPQGLACHERLFDDIGDDMSGSKGEQIQAGVYKLSIYSVGLEIPAYHPMAGDGTNFIFTSNPVTVVEECEVVASPSTKTYREVNDDGYTYSYYLKFSPSYSNGSLVENYDIGLHYQNQEMKDLYKKYSIKHVGEEWRFYYSGVNYFTLDTVVDGLETYVLIPLNGENGLNSLSGMSKTYIYTTNIYAVGSTTRFNSKTEPITIQLLGFDKNISLTAKGFQWNCYNNEGKDYASMVIYKMDGQEKVNRSNFGASPDVRTFLPSDAGLYEYIMFMTPGSIDKYSVVVESEIYIIRNVYKLHAPTVTVGAQGLFNITNSDSNPADYEVAYKITNNRSIAEQVAGEEELAMYISTSTYRAGTQNFDPASEYFEYKQTELKATSFNFVARGHDIETFDIVEEDDGKFQVMTFDPDVLFMASKQTSVKSAMLIDTANIFINSNGDIEWEPVARSNNSADYKVNFTDGTTVMAYKVVVEYYYETGSLDAENNPVYTKDGDYSNIYYTKNTVLPASYVRGTDESNDYKYYISVYAFPCYDSEALAGVTTSIDTLTLTDVQYSDDMNSQIIMLSSNGVTDIFTRLNDVQDIAVTAGHITWKSSYTDRTAYEYRVEYSGPSSNGVLPGTYTQSGGIFTFTIDATEELLSSGTIYTISVFVTAKDTSKNMMTSFIASKEDVQIVPKVASAHISTTNTTNEDGVTIDTYDLKAYFEQYRATTYTKEVQVIYTSFNANGELRATNRSNPLKLTYNSEYSYQTSFEVVSGTGVYNASVYKLYLQSGYTMLIEFVVVTTSENYLNSYTYEFELNRKGWGDKDAITYDADRQQFSWTYGQETEYYVLTDNTPVYKNQTLSSPETNTAILEKVTKDTILKVTDYSAEGRFYVKVWVDVDNDNVVDTGETVYLHKDSVGLRTITREFEDTVYYTVSIEYLTSSIEGETLIEKHETRVFKDVTDNFFFPEIVGATIVSFKVQAREGEKNVSSDWLEYELPAADAADAVVFSLFADGDGTMANPYQIETAEQFKNMELFGAKPAYLTYYTQTIQIVRKNPNTGIITGTDPATTTTITGQDSKYYFDLTAPSLEVESTGEFIINTDFPSVFNGNGNTIVFTSTSGVEVEELSGSSFAYSSDGSNIEFNQLNAIFRSIAPAGIVNNLKLAVNYTYAPKAGASTYTLFAGLAISNNGTVSNVEVTSFNVSATSTINSHLVLAGIVGINNRTITGCTFSATTDISNPQTASEQTILFGGVAGFNIGATAHITLCKVSASASVKVAFTKSQNGIVQIGGIAMSNILGKITLCGNEGTINGSSKGTGYAAGVVYYSQGGSLLDLYNVGNVAGQQIAGIVYYCGSTIGNCLGAGKLNNSTAIANNHIAYTFSGTQQSTCYGRHEVKQGVQTSALTSSTTFTTSNASYKMQIVVSGTTYTVTFAAA